MKKIISLMLCIVLAVSCAAMAVVSASADTKPRYVALVLDVSGSMRNGYPTRLSSEKEAALSFCKTTLSTQGNKIAVVVFGSGASVICEFTDDIDLLTEKINGISASGSTNFYDAFETSKALLDEEQAKGVDFQRNIVLCSDGIPESGKWLKEYAYTRADNSSCYDYANAALKFDNEEVKHNTHVYTIGFYQGLSGNNLEFAKRFMKDLSTSGSVIVDNSDDLIDAFNDFANEIIKDETPDTPDKPSNNTSDSNNSGTSSNTTNSAQANTVAMLSAQAIKTGDTSAFVAVFSISVVSLAVVAFMVMKRKAQN